MARLFLVPGIRFNPTDEEVVMYFLKRKLMGKPIADNVVAEVNIYDYHPSDLPDKSLLKSGDLEWYFFCPKSKRYSTGSRAKRATETGFWKATGKDRFVKYRGRTVATITTLVFHLGRAKDCVRTNWVLHEYRMADKQLAKAEVVQDTYVLCKIFEKSGAGPKNGAQYGAPFNEDEWDDDLVSSIDSQAIVGLVGASITTDHKQKGPATVDMTEPGSSIVTSSAMETISTLNYKQKGPATTYMTEPGSSSVPFSANEPANMLNYKQQGPATTSMTGPGLSSVTLSANEPTNTQNYKPKGPATTDMTEPGSSTVMFSAHEPTNTLNYKQKGPATMNKTEPGTSPVMFFAHEPTNTLIYRQKGLATTNMIVPQTTHGLPVTEPGSSSGMNETPFDVDLFNVDMFFSDDIDMMTGVPEEEAVHMEEVKTMTPSEDDGIFGGLDNIITLDDLNTDGREYTIDGYHNLDGPDLGGFFVD